jgi:hypothetical protein
MLPRALTGRRRSPGTPRIPPRTVLDTLRTDGAGLRSREAVTQGERCPPAPWDPTEKGLYVDDPLPGKEREFMLRGLRGQGVFVAPKSKVVMVHTAAGDVSDQGFGERIHTLVRRREEPGHGRTR